MTQMTTDTTSVQEIESKLWTDYMVALARHQENRRLSEEAWRDYVVSDLRSSVRQEVCYQCADLCEQSRNAMQEALAAWKRVAYPLHNIPLADDDKEQGAK